MREHRLALSQTAPQPALMLTEALTARTGIG